MSFTSFEDAADVDKQGKISRIVDVYIMNQDLYQYLREKGINTNRSYIVDAFNQKTAQAFCIYADDKENYVELTEQDYLDIKMEKPSIIQVESDSKGSTS